MPKWVFVVVALILTTGGVFAQDATPPLDPIGTLEAGSFRALAVTHDGDRLLVADDENKQVRVYNFTDPTHPTLLSTLNVSGTPILLAGGENFGLVAETTDGAADTIEVVAPPLPGAQAQYATGFNYIAVQKNPRALALSPDNHWGIALSESGYVIMEIHTPDNIDSILANNTFIDAALSNTSAFLLSDQMLISAPLQTGQILQTGQTLNLDGVPSLVTLNDDASTGVVVLDGKRLVFFDPARLQKTGEFALDGKPITSIHFLTTDGSQYLLVTQQDDSTVTVLNVADLQKIAALPAMQPLDKPIRALAIFQHFLIATDGVTIHIFSA